MKKPLHIAITGATGQLGYNTIFRMAAGEAFGLNQPIIFHLCDLPGLESRLEGIAMELEDCCTPLVAGIEYGSDLIKLFHDVDYAVLIGAKPRGPGMERAELLAGNGHIFTVQGKALNRCAKRDAKVLVVGNPCNTNCLVAMHHAPDLNRKNFHALLRLDQNRATALLAKKSKMAVRDIQGVTIWGNHSATQVPDFNHCSVKGQKMTDFIRDEAWLRGEFFEVVQKRGASVINRLGHSSAASAGQAIVDALFALYHPTAKGQWFSSGVCSDHNPYGIEDNLIFGFPCQSQGEGQCEIIPGLEWDFFIKEKMTVTLQELIAERDFCIKEGLIKT
ncbi:MAG: malate dehydrogenase [Verrucomicrobia bacterium]|nr:malate dehydrogenase [Verrucomicrobiota bacterium]MBS0645958.1 malate dehydrogenase [Verrucomicrobiota bacterium]